MIYYRIENTVEKSYNEFTGFDDRKTKSKKVDAKKELKYKSFTLHENDYITKIKGEYTTHISFLKFRMNSGKVFVVGNKIHNDKSVK